MEPGSCTQDLVPAVTKIPGEPAVLIIGVPRSSQSHKNGDQTSKENLKTQSKLESESESESDPEFDPFFGEWLEGRKVRKLFGDTYYSGKVVRYNAEANWYRVEYEDGDMEDLYWHELEEVLVPLDISIPLKDLALQHCYWDKAITSSGKKRGRSRKDSTTSVSTEILSGINELALIPVKVEYAQQPLVTNSKRGRKPKSNANITNSVKVEENLAINRGKNEVQAVMNHPRRREINRQGAMTTVEAERQKRKERQSRRSKSNAS